jgi:predicted amidohydrolase YtcJ
VQGPEWKITAEAALRMYTLGSAYAAFEDDQKGSISPGKLADLVVLDADPRQAEPEAIRDIRVLLTLVGGRPVFEG